MDLQNSRNRIIWGGLLVLLGTLSLLERAFSLSSWVWVVCLAVAGVVVAVLFGRDRSNRSALIPAYVLWAIALLIAQDINTHDAKLLSMTIHRWAGRHLRPKKPSVSDGS